MPPWLVGNFYINFNKLILPFGKYLYKCVTKYQIKGNRLLLSGRPLHILGVGRHAEKPEKSQSRNKKWESQPQKSPVVTKPGEIPILLGGENLA